MSGDSQPLEAGDSLGGFRVVERVGEGGMGIVFLAEDTRLGRRVALKVIAPALAHDREFRERFEAEARSAAAIDHPNVVPVYSAGSSDGRLYIAMRYVAGTDLRSLLRDSGPLGEEAALAVVADVAAALDAAHAAGLVHRDVKPANVLLDGEPGEGSAYLTDFGLTKGLQGSGGGQLTGTGQWIGTVDYVAPEQMTTGIVDARTDVYALGCVLFEAVAGEPPFAGSDMQKMWRQVNEPLPGIEPRGGDHPLDAVIARATAKEPAERFASAGDLARAAAAAIGGGSAPAGDHSVATGAAASGLASSDPQRTRTMRSGVPVGVREQRTTPMSAPPPPRPREHAGSGGRVAAIIAAAVVLAAGLIAGAVVLAGGSDGATSRTVVSHEVETVTSEPGADAEVEDAFEEPAPDAGESPSEGAGASASSAEPEATIGYAQYLYDVSIPAEWEPDSSDESNGTYYESTWHPPGDDGTTILVDAQTPAPQASPLESAESVRAQTSQSSDYSEIAFEPTTLAGRPAARWVFQVHGDRRVDYFLNDCNVGIAVLGSTYPSAFGAYAPTFHRAASSISVPCGE
jgi:hypothetical protein